MKKEPNITERQAREIVEKMERREPYTSKSIDDFYRSIGLEPEEPLNSPARPSRKKQKFLWQMNRQKWRPGKRQYRRNVSVANSAGCL